MRALRPPRGERKAPYAGLCDGRGAEIRSRDLLVPQATPRGARVGRRWRHVAWLRFFLSRRQRPSTFVSHHALQVGGKSPVARAPRWRVQERAAARAHGDVSGGIFGCLPPVAESHETAQGFDGPHRQESARMTSTVQRIEVRPPPVALNLPKKARFAAARNSSVRKSVACRRQHRSP